MVCRILTFWQIVKSNFSPPGSTSFEDYRYLDPLTKESFSIKDLVANINQKLTDNFLDSPPFTVQRLAELIVNPTTFYSSDQPQKFLSALGHVLSVSSTTEDFERLDTEALIKESQTSRNDDDDENELIGEQEESNSLNNCGGRSPSLLSQAASVVVMSPIPWASAATFEQQQDFDEDISMLENDEMTKTSSLACDVYLPLDESKLLEEEQASERDEPLPDQPLTDQNSEDSSYLADMPSATSTKALSTCQSPDNLEEKQVSTEDQSENHEEKQNSPHHLISDTSASKETQSPSGSQSPEKTKLQHSSQPQEQESSDSQKSENEEDQSLNKETSSEEPASSTTSTLNDLASDSKPTQSNLLDDDKKTETGTPEATKHELNDDKSNASLVSKNSSEKSEIASPVKEKRKEPSDTEPDATSSDLAETKLLGEKRRKLSVEPDEF